MNPSEVVTISFFQFEGIKNRWKAFRQMGILPGVLPQIEGLQFGKMLGKGGNKGFALYPDLGTYVLLCVWQDESIGREQLATHPLLNSIRQHSNECYTLFMKTIVAHGNWDRANPFQYRIKEVSDQPIAVLTRATVRAQRLIPFLKAVPKVSRSIIDRPGLLFSAGVGEYPIVQQATFSLWQNSSFMQAYAYQSEHHKQIVKTTRAKNWYNEDLFARFHPYKSEGSWRGTHPISF